MILANRRKNFLQSVPTPEVTQLVNEQFEGPGAVGWFSNTTSPALAWNDTYNTSPPGALTGSYSAQIESALTARPNGQKTFSANGNIYCRFLINHQRRSGGQGVLSTLRDTNGEIVASFGLGNGTNGARMQVLGASGPTLGGTPATGVTYYGWFEYEKAASTSGIARGGYTETGSAARPTWPLSGVSGLLAVSTGGNRLTNVTGVMFGRIEANINYNVIIDDIQIQSTPFP